VTFASCEAWVAAAYLLDHGYDPALPPCDHTETCPPLKPKTQEPK
jgi:hypothetical protein